VPVYGAAANKTAVAMGRETRMVEGDRGVIIYIVRQIKEPLRNGNSESGSRKRYDNNIPQEEAHVNV
jgi:hypothetical protein